MLPDMEPPSASRLFSALPGAAGVRLEQNGLVFSWKLDADQAKLIQSASDDPVWSGPLLPSILVAGEGSPLWVKAECTNYCMEEDDLRLKLSWGALGTGSLTVRTDGRGIRFEDLILDWHDASLAIISLYFGKMALTSEQRRMVERPEADHWAAWHAGGFCVPSAKGAPVQSFFRRHDFGEARIPLGSFGATMGTPYAAAYPRPIYAMAMGDGRGFMAFGAGEIPDAAMSLELEAVSGCLHFLYREDLWGAPKGPQRHWKAPLHLAWGTTAWDAFAGLFSMTPTTPKPSHHMKSQWNSWGEFITGHYELRPAAKTVSEQMQVNLFTIDMFWETSCSDACPDVKKFPAFDDDIAAIRDMGLELGFWQAVGWVADPDKVGLTDEDLLCGPDGHPRKAVWHSDPGAPTHHFGYFLDPASARARSFLRERTHRLMKNWNPSLLKLDFGYALPSPHSAASRDPAFRGERMTIELMRVIRDAAREINPDVTIQYYGLSPLMHDVQDVVALDDQADAGAWEAEGHRAWSVWAALAGGHGMPVMASTGYDWSVEDENLLNTAVIGAPGGLLPLNDTGSVPDYRLKAVRRSWVNRYFRKNPVWRPLWLNSEKGRIGLEPEARCFGRLEEINSVWTLTALALREIGDLDSARNELGMQWSGRWLLIAGDDQSIFTSRDLLVMPLDKGFITFPAGFESDAVWACDMDGLETQPAPSAFASNQPLTLRSNGSKLAAFKICFVSEVCLA